MGGYIRFGETGNTIVNPNPEEEYYGILAEDIAWLDENFPLGDNQSYSSIFNYKSWEPKYGDYVFAKKESVMQFLGANIDDLLGDVLYYYVFAQSQLAPIVV